MSKVPGMRGFELSEIPVPMKTVEDPLKQGYGRGTKWGLSFLGKSINGQIEYSVQIMFKIVAIIILLMLMLALSNVGEAAMFVQLQNRTVNASVTGFNEYVSIVSDDPFTCFQFNIEYNKNNLSLNYFRMGNMFQYVPAGKWLSYEGGGWYNKTQYSSNYYGGLLFQGNRSNTFTTYGTFNFKPLKKGVTYLQLMNVSTCYVDGNFSQYWNTSRYIVTVT